MAFKRYHDNMRFSIELDLGVPYFWTHIFYTEDNFEARVDMQQSPPIFEELVNTSLDSQYDSLTKLNHSCFHSWEHSPRTSEVVRWCITISFVQHSMFVLRWGSSPHRNTYFFHLTAQLDQYFTRSITGWYPRIPKSFGLHPRRTGWLVPSIWRAPDAHRISWHRDESCFSGWWFGTWILLFHILGIIIPTDELIFFRGVGIPPTSFTIDPRLSHTHKWFEQEGSTLISKHIQHKKYVGSPVDRFCGGGLGPL